MWEKFDWTAKLGLTRGKVRSGRRDGRTQAFLRLGPLINFTTFLQYCPLQEHSSNAFTDSVMYSKCHIGQLTGWVTLLNKA